MDPQPLEFPYEIRDVAPELSRELMKHYTGELTGFVQVGPKRYFLPQKYKQCAAHIYNMPIRCDDIFINTFPRSGTTWTQELIWLLQNNFNYEEAMAIPLAERFPFLDFSMLIHPDLGKQMLHDNKHDDELFRIAKIANMPGTERIAKMRSPRLIKSHLPLSLLPPTLLDTTKVVYVSRDPRDVAVSVYHFCKMQRIHGAPCDFKTFWNYFIKDLHYYMPIFEHVKEAWNQRNHHNMLFISYEELYVDLPFIILRVSKFFDKPCSEQQIQQLCKHLSFENFKSNKSVNHSLLSKINFINLDQPFIRKGIMGDWRDYFDDEMLKQAQNWVAQNLKDYELIYPGFRDLNT